MSQPPSYRSGERLDIRIRRRRSPVRRAASHWRAALALVLAVTLVGVGAIYGDVGGAGDGFERLLRRVDRLMAGPVPTRSSRPTVVVTEPPLVTPPPPTATPESTGGEPSASVRPTEEPTSTPTPPRVAVDVDLLDDPDAVFAHQATKDWCAVAGTAMVLAIHGIKQPTDAFQHELAGRVREWESYDDSHNGKWGPAAMALALEAYGVPGYEVRAYESRGLALRDAARQISKTGAPVILLTWRGAHTWVMTGYRADGDPRVFGDAKVSGAYILDPWYPSVSNIWGASNPPGFFTKLDELVDNYLRWKRPEGAYPDRDGQFISVVPTVPLTP